MVAIIKVGNSIRKTLHYNESKIKEGKAELIGAANYGIDADKLHQAIRLKRFTKQLLLNKRVKCNSVHISLNFDLSEISLPKVTFMAIAQSYMDKIGFGDQPYLVYQHNDTGHPHLHIVSINIQSDGKRIDLHYLGIRKSEPARKEIEKQFNLVKAQEPKKRDYTIKAVSAKIVYGSTASKQAMQNVLNYVVPQYKYTSLSEFNAILKQYNMMANTGSQGSLIAKYNGLLYHILDQNGKPIGAPVKASNFYNRPILKDLKKRFVANEIRRRPLRARVKNVIDMALKNKGLTTLAQLTKTLHKEGIDMLMLKNNQDIVNEVIYIDHKTKSTFNDRTLGREYGITAIQARCESKGKKLSGNGISLSKKSIMD